MILHACRLPIAAVAVAVVAAGAARIAQPPEVHVAAAGQSAPATPDSVDPRPTSPSPAATAAAHAPAGRPSEHPGRGHGRPTDDPSEPVEPEAGDPAFTVSEAELDASLGCSDLTDEVGSDRAPVLLVHGTFTWGEEHFGWSWLPTLDARGYDWCVVSYPDRGFGDLQVSAEYVAHALITMHEVTGRQVDMVGHSQGGLVPRWALKYWPSAMAATDDFVMIASPNHGTATSGSGAPPTGMPASFWQMRRGSAFVTTLNEGDESPGDVGYTSIYAVTDELIQPSYGPDATARLAEDGNVTNLNLQEACPGRVVDHVSIGTTDRAAFELTLVAFVQPGPLDTTTVDMPELCKSAPEEAGQLYDGLGQVDAATGLPARSTVVLASGVLPEPYQRFDSLPAGFDVLLADVERGGTWDWHMADHEPEIRPYAR